MAKWLPFTMATCATSTECGQSQKACSPTGTVKHVVTDQNILTSTTEATSTAQ
jgi:hypothetical protein